MSLRHWSFVFCRLDIHTCSNIIEIVTKKRATHSAYELKNDYRFIMYTYSLHLGRGKVCLKEHKEEISAATQIKSWIYQHGIEFCLRCTLR